MKDQAFISMPGPDRFGRALLISFLLEALAIGGFVLVPPAPKPMAAVVVRVKIDAPPAPKPVVQPPPPKPAPPPPPMPPPPVPVPAQLPPPPPPHPSHRVIRHVAHIPPPPARPVSPMPTPPAPPTPAPAAPPPAPIASPTVMARYASEVRADVLAQLTVPQILIDAGLSGDCVLEFTVAPDGTLLSASLLTKSGLSAVNQAALAALRAARLPAFLPGMPAGPHRFILPVHVAGNS